MSKESLKKYLLYFILLIPFFEPAYINVKLNFLDKIYEIYLALSCIFVVCVTFKKMSISKYTLIVIIFEFCILTFGIINNNLSENDILNAIKVIAITLLINYGMKYSCKEMLESIISILGILIIINFITIIIYPDGMYINEVSGMKDNWFLGMDNIHTLYFLPYIMCLYLKYKIYKKISFMNSIGFVSCLLSVLIRWSATTVVGITLIILFMIFDDKIYKTKIFNLLTYIITYIILYFGIVIFRIQETFSFFIENVLKKDVTFTKRTFIWDMTMNYIHKRPLLGYGCEDSKVRMQKFNVVHAHNIFLEITYQGGLILLCVFIWVIYTALKELNKYKNEEIARVLMFIIFTFFIMMITEAYAILYIIIILTICSNIKYIMMEKRNGETNAKN